MSAGGFDANHSSPMYQRYEPRRSSGTFPAPNYNRLFNHPPRRRTPSPTAPRRFTYDSYTPTRVDPSYRNEHSNTYRPNNYRPDYSAATGTNPWERSPSPDTYPYPVRPQDTETRDRANTWHPPPKSQPVWQDRKPVPTSPMRERPRRDDTMATRIFEPSDAWKRDHIDRPARFDGNPVGDRYLPYRRENSDNSPDRPRHNRGFPIPGGDRYRPPQEPFHSQHNPRSEYDSYRPPYEDSWSPPAPRESVSAPVHRRGPSGPHHMRGHFDFRAGGRQPPSTSVSPKMFHRFPEKRNRGFSFNQDRSVHSDDQQDYEGQFSRAGYPDHDDDGSRRSKSIPSRPSSRSSIASSVPSERHDVSSSSTAPIVSEQAKPEEDNPLAAETPPEHPKSPARRSSSCPRDIRSPDSSRHSLTSSESSMKDTRPPPLQPEAKDDDITEEAEVQQLLSQNQSEMKLPRDRNDQHAAPPQSPPLISSPRFAEPISHSIVKPESPLIKSLNGTETVEIRDVEIKPSIISSKSPPTPRPPPDDQKPEEDREISTPIAGESQPPVVKSGSHETGQVPTELAPLKDHLSPPPIAPRLTETIISTSTSVSSLEPIQKVSSKGTPVTPLSEPPPSLTSPAEICHIIRAKPSMTEALRIVVMARLLCDRQKPEERISPILKANLALAPQPEADINEKPDADRVVQDMVTGPRFECRMRAFRALKPSLVGYLSQRQTLTNEKIQKLRQEYTELHEKWLAHCHALNEQAKPSILEGESMPIGRTTRRSANLGDAVRSDLEMEQILASLESNDATDPNHLSQRNLATIPDMISVTKGEVDCLFDDTSHRVENPAEYYAPNTGIHDWTEEEKKIFLDKYAAYPKQFNIIAEFLPNKTSSQCVDYYYLHKKNLIDFRKVVSKLGPKRRRRGAGKRKGNALLADIRRHDEEVHRDSGSPSTAPSQAGKRGRKPKDSSETNGERRGPGRPPKRIIAQMQEKTPKTPTETPTPEPENKGRRKRAAATLLLSAPLSRTASLNPEEPEEDIPEPDQRPAKRAKRTRKVKSAAIVEDEPTTPEMDIPPLPELSTPTSTTGLSVQSAEQDKSRWRLSIITPS